MDELKKRNGGGSGIGSGLGLINGGTSNGVAGGAKGCAQAAAQAASVARMQYMKDNFKTTRLSQGMIGKAPMGATNNQGTTLFKFNNHVYNPTTGIHVQVQPSLTVPQLQNNVSSSSAILINP